jgi:gluconokinase
MGVCGSGKSTIGILLAEKLGYSFFDADEFHPQSNVDKMAGGQPLDDDDRRPWLMRLNEILHTCDRKGTHAVLACSALKQSYRDLLAEGLTDCRVVYLKGDYDTIYDRMASREDHFMTERMLHSQFDALEEPAIAMTLNIADEPEAIVAHIEEHLSKAWPIDEL